MATEQKYVTIPNVSFDLEQLLDIIRQLDEPAQRRMVKVLTETLAESQRTTDTNQQAELDQETSRLRLDWIGCLSDLHNKPTSVELQHQILLSFDHDFNHTKRGRTTPIEVLNNLP